MITGSKTVTDMTVSTGGPIDIRLPENDRRFAGYDHRLRRPTTVPSLARFVPHFLRG
jgi:hypothetical protein